MEVSSLSKVISLFIFTMLLISLFSFTTSYSITFADNIVFDEQNKLSTQNKNTSFQSITDHKEIILNENLYIKSMMINWKILQTIYQKNQKLILIKK